MDIEKSPRRGWRLKIDWIAFIAAVILTAFGLYLVKSRAYLNWFDWVKSRLDWGSRQSLSTTTTIRDQRVVFEESAVIQLVEQVSPAVVSIVTREVGFDPFTGPYAESAGIGTGFIIDAQGLVLTNSHVVEAGGDYTVVLSDDRTFEVKKVHLDRLNDLAILEIDASRLPVVELGDSDALKVGQTVVAIGNALGRYGNTVTTGVVSGIARQVTASGGFGQSKTFEDVIQTDAALNPGNSGGPLLNLGGQVIGINVATTSGADNIGFAIPINVAKPVISDFIKLGKISRPFIGVEYVMVSKDMASLKRLPEGAFVKRVLPGSPADKAGIEAGDIITHFDNSPVNEDSTLSSLIQKKRVGDKVALTLDRAGQEVSVTLTLGEAEKFLDL